MKNPREVFYSQVPMTIVSKSGPILDGRRSKNFRDMIRRSWAATFHRITTGLFPVLMIRLLRFGLMNSFNISDNRLMCLYTKPLFLYILIIYHFNDNRIQIN